jgi:hypothetical protein
MDAVPKIYIRSLKHSALGFALVAPQAILQLTVKRYDIISPKDIEDNLAKLNAPWNPDTPIDTVFANGDECRRFASDADDSPSDKAYLRILINTFRNSGVMDKAVEDWHLKQDCKTIQAATTSLQPTNFAWRAKATSKTSQQPTQPLQPSHLQPTARTQCYHLMVHSQAGTTDGPME